MGGVVILVLGILMILGGIIFAVGLLGEGSAAGAIGALVLGVVVGGGMIGAASAGSVTTRNVGVVTSFNKPTGEIKPAGFYWAAPWESVTEMDLAWQTTTYEFNVQASGGTTVGVSILPRWRMVPEAAPDLFQNYKSFDGVVNNLFKTELVDASNQLFAVYNPLTNIDVKTGNAIKSKEAWASDLKVELEKRLSGKIIFDRVAIPTIAPDQATQEKLNQQVAEFGRGKVLDQQKVNADKQKIISQTNAEVDKVTRCLEIAEKTNGEPGLCLNPGIVMGTK